MPVKRPVCLICLIFLFMIYIFTQGPPSPSWDVDKAADITVTVRGKVVDRQEKNGSFQVYLTNVSIISDRTYFPETSKGIVVKLAESAQSAGYVRIGSKVEARGVFVPFEKPRCEGMFDSRTYYLIKGYDGQLKRARITGVSAGYDRINEALRRVRDKAYDIMKDNMGEDDAALLAAMTLGDKSGLDAEIKELYQRAGISHVLALSGLHIASVGLALLALFKRTGMPSKAASFISFFIIAAYAVMTGMSVSTVRAMIMFGLFVLADFCGRTYDLLSGASVSALIILIIDPLYLYDTGFLLSFGAVLGIAIIFPVFDSIPTLFLRTRKSSDAPFVSAVKKVYQAMCVSLSVTVATFPVMGNSFMQISVFSVVLNLAVIPLMGVVLFTGFAGIIAGFSGVDPGFIFKITHYILLFFETSGNIFEKIPGNILVIGKPAKWQIITYAIVTGSAVITWHIAVAQNNKITRKEKGIDPTGRRLFNNIKSYEKNSRNKITYLIQTRKDRRIFLNKKKLITTITLVMFLAASTIFMLRFRCDIEIRTVDVGQGDCTFICGSRIPNVIIDGGSSDIKKVGKNRIGPVLKANRIQTVDWCFLTHMDDDHVNGVIEMLEDRGCGIRIRRVAVSSYVLNRPERSDNLLRLLAAAQKSGTDIVAISAGDVLDLKDVRLVCISPPQNGAYSGGETTTDENDNSLVIRLEYDIAGGEDFRALFTGDIGAGVERSFISEAGECTYLKVAHHGSRNSSADDFLKKVDPKISVISAGVDNSYGHPHKETIERLKKTHSSIYCTNETGEIITFVDDGKIVITTMSYYNDS